MIVIFVILIPDQWWKIDFFFSLLTNMLNKNITLTLTSIHTNPFNMEDTSDDIRNNFLFSLFILGNSFLSSLTDIQIAKRQKRN